MNGDRVARIRARELTDDRVQRMRELLVLRDPESLNRLREDALSELALWSELDVVTVPDTTSTDCGIAGIYIDTATPPRIGVVRSLSRARENFTALHELGHHLQRTDEELLIGLAGQTDRGRVLEEDTADRFAASILIPPALVIQELGSGTPSASQVVSLWRQASGSRAAVCVAAARQLESPGHVLLVDPEGLVNFCATKGEFRLRRGSDQSSTAIVRRVNSSSLASVSVKTRFAYSDGWKGAELYAQTASIDGFTLIVAVTDHAPWEVMSLSSTAPTVVGEWHECNKCGDVFRSWQRCERGCGAYSCSNGHCDCPTYLKERLCESCFEVKPAHLFDGVSAICNPCLT